MKTLRTGVIGVGHLGYHHARNYAALPDAELVGVVDTNPANRERAAGDFTVPGFSDVEALIACGVDAVSVATPTSHHHDAVVALLQAGVDVLVEKPIAGSLLEAEAMVAVAKAHNCLLQVGHIERYNGAVMAFMRAIEKPRFIECHRLSPFPGRGADVSVVLDLMIHDLDIVLAMIAGEVVSLDAVGVPVLSAQEDIANVRLRFDTGCVANLTSSRVSMEKMRKIRIFEGNAYLSTDYNAQEVLVYRKSPGPIPEGSNPMEHIQVEPLPVKRGEPLHLELADFLESVRQRRKPLVSGEDGLRALQLAQDITDFIRKQH